MKISAAWKEYNKKYWPGTDHYHNGIDYVREEGEAHYIYPIEEGIIIYAGKPENWIDTFDKSYGPEVVIMLHHKPGYYYFRRYAHIGLVSWYYKNFNGYIYVTKCNEPIGMIARKPSSGSGAHLHTDMWFSTEYMARRAGYTEDDWLYNAVSERYYVNPGGYVNF